MKTLNEVLIELQALADAGHGGDPVSVAVGTREGDVDEIEFVGACDGGPCVVITGDDA